ncbi:MAG TPA: hypothetical protein VMR43_19065, partial [Variovorax sp.]|nr:hypothetical protein [Variovorax sp.]
MPTSGCSQFATNSALKPLIGQRLGGSRIAASRGIGENSDTIPPVSMAKRTILSFPDPRLHTVAKP